MVLRDSQARVLIVVLAMLGFAGACGDPGNADAPEPEAISRPVSVEGVKARSYASWTNVPGIVEADVDMELAFRVAGFVETLSVEEGQRVEAGAVVARLDPRDYEREVRSAQAILDSAEARAADTKREFDRQERLLDSNSTSTRSLESARSAHQISSADARQARVGLETARVALEDCVLRAPVTGHVQKRQLEEHEFASARTAIIVLSRLEPVKVRASVADRHLASLVLGGKVEVRSGAWPGRVFAGRISQLAVGADSVTHTIPFEVEVANADLALRPDMVVEASVATGVTPELVTLPINAVVRDGALRTLCFVAEQTAQGLRAATRPLVLGPLQGNRVVIERGIAAGDRVIVRGQHFLRHGDPIHLSEGLEVARAEESDE